LQRSGGLYLNSLSLSVSQLFDIFLVHAEVVGDFVQHREADFFAQSVEIGEVFQEWFGEDGDLVGQERRIEARSFRQWHTLVQTVNGIFCGIEILGEQQYGAGKYEEGAKMFEELTLREDFVEFLTLPAYDYIIAHEHR